MTAEATTTRHGSRGGLFVVASLALGWSVLGFVPPGPLHADEAVQWSLARELSEGTPYSAHQDRFHGPTLATTLLIIAKLTGTGLAEMSEHSLRSVVSVFLGLMAAAALIVPTAGKAPRIVTAAFIVLTGGCTPFGYYLVQEMLLVAGFVWGVALWMRAEESPATSRWRFLSGLAFGFALACKVTAAAYLGCFFLALFCLRPPRGDRRWWGFALGLIFSWAFFQSVAFTDLAGLTSWWSQLARALGVAGGYSADTLLAHSLVPWFLAVAWLVVFALARSGLAFADWRVRRPGDLPWLVAIMVLLFHGVLPYKTPWLLLLVFSLPLTLTLPDLLGGRGGRAVGLAAALVLIAWWARGPLADHSPTADLRPFVSGVERLARADPDRFFIAIEGGHYWPLPYYLRRQRVGFGDFPQASQAPLRLIPAVDTSEPVVPGYAVSRLTLRAGGDAYWVLVAKDRESLFLGP